MAGTTITLQTNIPNTASLSNVYFNQGSGNWPDGRPKGDQISVAGTWDIGGQGKAYLHIALEGELQRLGVIGVRQGNSYPLLFNAPRVRFTKREEGTKKFTHVELLSHSGAVAPAMNPPQQQSPAYSPPPQQAVYNQPAPLQQGNPREMWGKICATMAHCFRYAKSVLTRVGLEEEDVTPTAHTLFIQAARMNLWISPEPAQGQSPQQAIAAPEVVTANQLDQIANLCVQLKHDEMWVSQQLSSVYKCQVPTQLPKADAEKFIGTLTAELAAAKAVAAAGAPLYGEDIPF